MGASADDVAQSRATWNTAGASTHRSELSRNISVAHQAITRRMEMQRGENPSSYDGARDYYQVLGYKRDPDIEDFRTLYKREHIAQRIVDAPASTSWREFPDIVDEEGDADEPQTEFEKDVQTLVEDHRLGNYIERADTLAGLGTYGVLVLGFKDGRDTPMAKPVQTESLDGPDDLAYLSPFSKSSVNDIKLVEDPTLPRYGKPEQYKIQYTENGNAQWTHWTRVLHIPSDRLFEDEIHGRPRLEPVFNLLIDLLKVLGGSAEMTWRGADRKYVANHTGEGQIIDKDELKQEVTGLIHDLQPVAYLKNVELDTIDGQAVDPSGIVENIMKMIAGGVGQPKRMLTGSERGELASTQDRATWYGRIQERRETFCGPQILRPLLERLVDFGILSPPTQGDNSGDRGDFELEWSTLFELNEVEKAEVRSKNATALKTSAPMGDTSALASEFEIREQIMDWNPEPGSESSLDRDDGSPLPDPEKPGAADPPDDDPEQGDGSGEQEGEGEGDEEGQELPEDDETSEQLDELMGRA